MLKTKCVKQWDLLKMPLPCGHHEACLYRYRHRGVSQKYCFACIVEKFQDANVNKMWEKLREIEKKKNNAEEEKVNKKQRQKKVETKQKELEELKAEDENKSKKV